MSIHARYTYVTTKEKIVAEMKTSSKQTLLSLEKNISSLMSSFAINEYENLILTEMERRSHYSIIVEDIYMGKILGTNAYYSGKIRETNGNIIDYDPKKNEQIKKLAECCYTDSTDIMSSSGEKLGSISIYLSYNDMNDELNKIIDETIINAISISLLLFFSLLITIRFFILKPISNIISIIKDSDEDGLPVNLFPDEGAPEINSLSTTMNKMIYAIKNSNDILNLQHHELISQQSQLKILSLATEQSPVSILICNENNIIEYVNPQFEKTSGYSFEESIGRSIEFLFQRNTNDKNKINDAKETLKSTKKWIGEITPLTKSGKSYILRISASAISDNNDLVSHHIYVAEDITEQRQREEILRNTQKLDALGKLTGGVAHDYNNLLGIIMGYAELLSDKLVREPILSKYVHDIQHAAERGSKLSNKLLAFTRHKTSDASVLNINKLLIGQKLMLERTLTARVSLIFNLDENLWAVKLDSGDLEDAIINMSINAMHAMNGQGQLTIATNNEHLNEFDAQQLHLKPGDYVLLSITDTGNGMDDETKQKLFDPFYSTKGDAGTGLGLSQVYGFIERCNGNIKVYSEQGHGSCFALYFPRSNKSASKKTPKTATDIKDLTGRETILVVDDEPALVDLAKNILSTQGYRILTASNGEQALLALEREAVDLLFSDVIMPNMDGYQLAARVRQVYPDIKIQMVSGFDAGRFNLADDTLQPNLLHKPYTSKTLLVHIRSLLDEDKKTTPSLDKPKIKSKNISGCKILIMDDDIDIRDLFEINLNSIKCEAITACNGEEAIAIYQQSINDNKKIDVIILDLHIPGGMGGKEVALKIREIDPEAKILVSSGDTNGSIMTNFQENGFNGVLEKNFNRENIKHTLENIIFPN